MPLIVAVQMDPIERINIKSDSTFALMLEAKARGHSLLVFTPDKLSMRSIGSICTATMRGMT